MKYSVYIKKPDDFTSTREAAGCYCEWQDKILLLKRNSDKEQGNTWGIPGGKIDFGENARMAVIREVSEEVALYIDDEGLLELGKLYCRLPHVDYIFHVFRKRFFEQPNIILGLDEHCEARWVTPTEALQLPLIAGGIEALEFYREKSNL